jgi:hypothetical protein
MTTVKNGQPERTSANSRVTDEEIFVVLYDTAEVMARALRLFGADMTKPVQSKPDSPA